MNIDRRALFKYLIGTAPVAIAIRSLAATPRKFASGLSGSALGQVVLGQLVQPPASGVAGGAADGHFNGPVHSGDFVGPVRVACVGDSITQGGGTSNKALFSYPAQLKRMLDDKWDVRNFGVSGTTLLNAGDFPYQRQDAFASALAFRPNVVVIMLGTNDSKPQNWKFKANFTADYVDLIGKFNALASAPRIFLCLPVPCFGAGNYGINEAAIDEELPLIHRLAESQHLDVIDMQTPFAGQDAMVPDRVHPNNDGAALMAGTVYKALTGTEYAGPSVRSMRALVAKAFGLG
jgi:lysophospholipase L1-like esterase